MKKIVVTGAVQKFPGPGGWHFVALSSAQSAELKQSGLKGVYGFIPIIATLGKTTWKTSLLPGGKGIEFRYLIALKAVVRKKERIAAGDNLSLTFDLAG